MALYTRSGRARPQGGGFELAVWYLVRLTGLALFVLALAHFSVLHFIYDPAIQNADFIISKRWSSIFIRAIDWLFLMSVLVHGFLGMRTVVNDYVKGGPRIALTMGLYLLAFVLFALGTIVVATMRLSGAAG